MTPSAIINVVKRERLPFAGVAHEFVGKQYGVVNSILFVTAPPGCQIPLHRHDYDEIIVVQEGWASCTVGDKEREVSAGDIVPIRQAHCTASPTLEKPRCSRSISTRTLNLSPTGLEESESWSCMRPA
jgi:mannose-6-phosphate isomerase-like protein (cupin superfamily)